MRVLLTFPGRFGDIAWMLPSARALSRRLGQPVDLLIAGEFASIIPLLNQQPYLGAVLADVGWSDHARQPEPPAGYDAVLHLGYRGWPAQPLPYETLDRLNDECSKIPWKPTENYWGLRWSKIPDEELCLDEPWITLHGTSVAAPQPVVAVGFTEAWFELKLGLLSSLARQGLPSYLQLTPVGSRWTTETNDTLSVCTGDWVTNAVIIRDASLFFGDCSALHVLAVALGTPAVICEPMEARHNKIFYPLGWEGPQVTIVKGNDGKPTFDARACRDAIQEALRATSVLR